MGCIWSCFGSDKSKVLKNKETPKYEAQEKSDSPKPDFKAEIEDQVVEEMGAISELELNQAVKKSFKGGGSSYAKTKRIRNKISQEKQDSIALNKFLAKRGLDFVMKSGSGNYATVYKAIHRKTGRYIAVKVINRQLIGINYSQNFLPNELNILEKMPKHRNIIRIWEVIRNYHNRIFILMEFAEKGTLTDFLINNGSITESIAKDWFKQILDGLDVLHSLKIAHRDLKLENILLKTNNILKITDFSYSIIVDPQNPLSDQFCGSLPYFAPEILLRKPHNPLSSDIWSIGVCFYILLNDKLPFSITDESLMLRKQLNNDWNFRRKVEIVLSPELKDFIRSIFKPNSDLRPTTKTLKSNIWFTQQNHNTEQNAN